MSLFTSFFIALLGSMLLVPPLMRLSGRLHLMDVPDARKVHSGSIPRSGGIAIVLGALIPIVVWFPSGDQLLLNLLLGGGVIVLFGLIDDRMDLDYRWKFFGQVMGVLVAMRGGLLIETVPFFGIEPVSPLLSYPLTMLFLLGVTNAINFSDGLDGLAAGSSLLSLSAIAWLGYQSGALGLTLVCLAVMGSVCGFLRYNNYPAVVFMGDAGSQFLGFMAGGLAVLLTQHYNELLNPALLLLLLGLPILDTLTVMTWRIRRGESPFRPDRNHFHHRLLEFGFRHYEAVSAIYLTQALLITSALFLRYGSDLVVVAVYLLFSLIVMSAFRWARVAGWRLHPEPAEGEFVERRNMALRQFDWLPHASARTTEIAAGLFMTAAALIPTSVDRGLAGIALGVAVAFGIAYAVPALVKSNVRRVAVYVTGVCCVYGMVAVPMAPWASVWLTNVYILLFGAVLVLAIRVTRREQFRTTPLDLLILFFVLVALVLTEFSDGSLSDYDLGGAVVRLAVLFYAGEFLFSKGEDYQRLLSGFALAALLILAGRGFGILP